MNALGEEFERNLLGTYKLDKASGCFAFGSSSAAITLFGEVSSTKHQLMLD